jgi:transglutaminase-like putative cysteine protease
MSGPKKSRRDAWCEVAMNSSARAHLDQPLVDLGDVDLDAAEQVTYVLRQTFRYDYDGPASDLRHRLVVVPRVLHGNLRRRVSDVRVSAPEAVVRRHRDRHGNPVIDVHVEVVPPSVEFTVQAVLVRAGGYQHADVAPDACHAPSHLCASPLTAADASLRELAAELRRESGDDLEFADRCSARVHELISYEYGVTTTATTAAQALALGRGVCQDHAHVMLAICRAAGVPARYVSGHLLGEGGTHAWVEVLVVDATGCARAVAFDPCNGCRAGLRHITIAVGRDYADVAPTSGRFTGLAQGALTVRKHLGVTAAA